MSQVSGWSPGSNQSSHQSICSKGRDIAAFAERPFIPATLGTVL